MKKVIRRFFIASSAEKEEKWLNEMALKGYVLKKASLGNYVFNKTEKKYKIRLAFMPENKKEFINFIEETNAQYISEVGNWGYFLKEVESFEESFEIYSDIDSRIEQNARVIQIFAIIALSSLLPCISAIIPGMLSDTLSSSFKVILIVIFIILVSFYVFMLAKLIIKNNKLKEERNIQE
ncbi:hypothetical protein CW664_11110 [Macrococcoides caseolyticum]|nr:hypothetical protein CW664_11110 [Macrococcus caseolyticus]